MHGDSVELGLRRPGSARTQASASLGELTFAQVVRGVQEVQFVLDIRALEHMAEPPTLRLRVTGKVEND